MNQNKKLLDKEIETQILNLSVMESGSEEKNRAVKDVAELCKIDIEDKARKRENIHRILDTILGGIGIAATVGVGLLGVRWRAEFEKDGVVTGRAYDELGKVLGHILKRK